MDRLQLDLLQRAGKVVVAYLSDNTLRRFSDHVIFPNGTTADGNFLSAGFSAVLLPPHHYATSAAFVETMYRSSVLEAPFVWHPRFYNHFSANLTTRR